MPVTDKYGRTVSVTMVISETAPKKPRGKRDVSNNYNHEGVPGKVTKKRARSTNTVISLFHNKQAGRESSARWSVVCEDHGSTFQDDYLPKAVSMMSKPRSWCSNCRKLDPVECGKFEPIDNHK